ncbi:hydratase [Caballeronia sordidicola]|uniref:Hydratase n=1 Tax=Caballeronia sordidicola TaxID=196367 RepID=A0A158GDY7_CABSO|nr:MaoC family dehydratase [Caballeronia sordidicola]SAL30061.1 hydratase [Caballeronia sordidicola]
MADKERRGNFFEDFHLDQVIRHGTPRTVTEGDASMYVALTGSRAITHSSATAAQELGFTSRPIDDLLVFNIAFGKTVPDISMNAIANLGYAEARFLCPVYAGNTLHCESVVIGLKENSSGKSGVVYVRSTAYREDDHPVITWVRWVMVHKRVQGKTASTPEDTARKAASKEHRVPALSAFVPTDKLLPHARLRSSEAIQELGETTGSLDFWEDYAVGERINHPSGATVEEAEHMLATRLYQNNARPHFDALAMRDSRVGRRLVYGGHVISVCRALAYDGLENVLSILAINAGTHVAAIVAGDTLYAYSEVVDKWKLPGRTDVAALRLRLVGLKNTSPSKVERAIEETDGVPAYHPGVVLDLDYTVLMPRAQGARLRHS